MPNNHIAPNKGIARKNDKKIINISGPNKHIAGKTLKFTGLNYLRLCHYFVTTSKGYRGLWGEVVPFDAWLLHPEGWTGSLGLTHLPNSHMLAPRAIPWDRASAGMLNHVRGRCRCSIVGRRVHQIGLTARMESVSARRPCTRDQGGPPDRRTPAVELGVEPRRRMERRTRHLPAAPASHLASSRLDPVLPLEQAGWDEGVRLALRKPASL